VLVVSAGGTWLGPRPTPMHPTQKRAERVVVGQYAWEGEIGDAVGAGEPFDVGRKVQRGRWTVKLGVQGRSVTEDLRTDIEVVGQGGAWRCRLDRIAMASELCLFFQHKHAQALRKNITTQCCVRCITRVIVVVNVTLSFANTAAADPLAPPPTTHTS
jgi:hypothetical protein